MIGQGNRNPLAERFESSYVPEPNSGCWLWIGTVKVPRHNGKLKAPRPYINVNGRERKAYQVSYETFVGPIPEGKFICHRCDVSICVNPNHLYAGDAKTNAADCMRTGRHAGLLRRRKSIEGLHVRLTHCRRGHELNSENLYTLGKKRTCRCCARLTRRIRVAKRLALKSARGNQS